MKKVILIPLLTALLCGCKTELLSELGEREANRIVAVLHKHGIFADKLPGQKGTSIIEVDKSDFADAVLVLEANGLPGNQFDTFGSMFEKSGMLPTPTEEKARYMYAITQELSQSISMLDGIINARVHLVLPKTDKLGRPIEQSSASVMLLHSEALHTDAIIPKIKLLIKNSIEGIDNDRISIILFPKVEQDVNMLDTIASVDRSFLRHENKNAFMKAGVGILAFIPFIVSLLFLFKKFNFTKNKSLNIPNIKSRGKRSESTRSGQTVRDKAKYEQILEKRRRTP